MLYLLPEQEKKVIYREYNLRRLIVAISLLSLLFVIAFISALPSYFISRAEKATLENQVKQLKSSEILREEAELMKVLQSTSKKIDDIRYNPKDIVFYKIVEKIIEKKTPDISIGGFVYANFNLTISGIAKNRESLTLFAEKLGSDDVFEKVNLPVSNFAKDKNINYTVELSIKH